jgi:hypothetical protein
LNADRRVRRALAADGPVTQQSIAAARFGLQKVPEGAKRLADRHGMNVQRVVGDDRARPDAVHQLVFADDLAGRAGEHLDDLESAAAYGDGGAEDAEFAARQVDFAFTRGMNQPDVLVRHVHGPSRGLVRIFCRFG